ncbi:hypothetical protein J7E50_25880 [Pedobacter sp. ISL-68]|uniref:hypothetical protein n=1 Tax=unclassified Pedobacter TaxID=2628915 RepID=UPI001BE94C87|nr:MULTISPECIES: hypothetical protein [unclassified Pedobacter]MBT2564809.1 hypothetical protein [Pedobacter sp. ISL-64]MBT2593671.1 hypothetical protein [Pedobacter sp. ISL-68]
MDISNKTIYYSGLNALRLDWPAEVCLKYGVLIIFNEGEENSNEVKYEVRVTRLKPGKEGQPLFQIERISDVFVNEILPDLVADRLAYAAGKVFYPLVITVDQNGGFQSIYNHQDILKRWESVKKKVLDNFEGGLVEDYVERMEKQLANADSINLAFLNNDWFIHTFFKPVYKEYGQNHITESIYKFPIARGFNVEGYLTQEKLAAQSNSFGAIELIHDGTIMPLEDELYITNRATGNYEGYYLLHPKFKRIISVVSDFSYGAQEKAKVKVKIALIPENDKEFDHDFELDTNVKGLPVTEMVVLDGPSKKGFWDRLLNN